MARYAHEDLVCSEGHRARLLLGDDEPLPTCSSAIAPHVACGKLLMRLDEAERIDDTRYVQVFKPFVYEGVSYTDRAQWERHKAAVAANLMVPVSQLVELSPDRHADRVKADEAAHRGYMGRRRAGHDEVSYRDYVKEQRRKSGKDERIVVGYRGTR